MVIEALRWLGKRLPFHFGHKRAETVFDGRRKANVAEQHYLAPGWMRPILRSAALSTRPSEHIDDHSITAIRDTMVPPPP
jgi:hypothetical protein